MVKENLERVRERISAAARAAGRDPAEIRLIAVTKGIFVERIREAIDAGVTEIGENRVQETVQKQAGLSAPVFWHLIGHLQKNKAGTAAERFDVVHSVDSPELIEALEKQVTLRQAPRPAREPPCRGGPGDRPSQRDRPLEALIQVNVSGEATKGGCRPEEAGTLAEALLGAKHLKWIGLMTMAPFSENPENSRPFFHKLRELRDTLEGRFRSSLTTQNSRLHLSMGMSGDFEVAVQEGATMVRIGTAIFK